MQFFERGERVRKGMNSSSICDKDSKGGEIGQERRESSEGIRGNVEFL